MRRGLLMLVTFFVVFTGLLLEIKLLDFLPILDTLGRWAFTAPIAIVTIILIFRRELAGLIEGVSSATLGKEGLKFERAVQAVQLAKTVRGNEKGRGDEIVETLTFSEIKEVFLKIPALSHISEIELNNLLPIMWFELTGHGIVTLDELEKLASSTKTIDTLADLYINVLGRKEDAPLDPSALASWGSYLFVHDVSSEAVNYVKTMLRTSDEYKARHPKEAGLE